MTFDRKDFARIRASLAVAVALFAAGAVLVWLADREKDVAARQQKEARARLDEYERKLRQVSLEEREIKEKSALYGKLRTRGIIGEEQRLEWVELLRDIRDTRKLLDLQYEFSPQQSLEKGVAGNYDFKSSLMRTQIKLLHEGDLLNLIDDLRSQAKALVRVRSCNVTRVPRGIAGGGENALLNGECEIEWITILPAKG